MSLSTAATSPSLPSAQREAGAERSETAAPDVIVESARQAFDALIIMPALPDGAERKMVVRSLPAREAASLLCILDMSHTPWRVVNRTAVQGLAKAHDLLRILAEGAFPVRANNPGPASATLETIRLCEESLRLCAAQVGGSFEEEVVPLCDDIVHHVRASGDESRAWVVRNAKALGKRVAKLSKATHTLSQVDDEDKAADQKKAIGEEGY